MPHMTTYGDQMDRKWTRSDQNWAGSGMEVSICPSVIQNNSHTSSTNLMRGIYKHRALVRSDFLKKCDQIQKSQVVTFGKLGPP